MELLARQTGPANMSWTSLQMISLGSLLLFGDRPLCAGRPRCIREKTVTECVKTFEENLDDRPVSDLYNRSVSPWRYREDRNDSRYPSVIYRAECLHSGCVINGIKSDSYNSVAVVVSMEVLFKSECVHDPRKYMIRREKIDVPVACTCVYPRYG